MPLFDRRQDNDNDTEQRQERYLEPEEKEHIPKGENVYAHLEDAVREFRSRYVELLTEFQNTHEDDFQSKGLQDLYLNFERLAEDYEQELIALTDELAGEVN